MNTRLRNAVLLVAALNLAYGLIEMAAAVRISSVSLFADSIDFFEDGAVTILIACAVDWTGTNRVRLAVVMAFMLFVPAAATLRVAVLNLSDPVAPTAVPLGLVAGGALAVNLFCAALLARHRQPQIPERQPVTQRIRQHDKCRITPAPRLRQVW